MYNDGRYSLRKHEFTIMVKTSLSFCRVMENIYIVQNVDKLVKLPLANPPIQCTSGQNWDI